MTRDDFYAVIGRLTCLKYYLKPSYHTVIDDLINEFIKDLAESSNGKNI